MRWLKQLNIGFLLCGVVSATALGQSPDSVERESEQRNQLAALEKMDGKWSGPAWRMGMDGQRVEMRQTEHIQTLLDGTMKLIEGKGYDTEGKKVFHAIATLAYDTDQKRFVLHSHAQGRIGDFTLKITEKGYQWEIPAGPATIRYTSEIDGDTLYEYGERLVPGREPLRFFEMRLNRAKVE